LTQEKSIKENGKMESEVALEKCNMVLTIGMKGIGKIISGMAKVFCKTQMGIDLREILKTGNEKDMGSYILKMGE